MNEPWLRHLEDLLDAELEHGAPDSPFRPAVLRWAAANGRPTDPVPLLGALEASRIGGRGGARRYHWSFPVASWVPDEERAAWRPREAEAANRHAFDHPDRLWVPVVLVEHVEWLERTTHADDPRVAARARRLLEECMPTLEDDVAHHVLGEDPWADTFLLWAFARQTRALTQVRGLASAIASRYAARATRSGSLVLGRTYPFFEIAMPSATAHLASAAARIGEGIDGVAPAIDWLMAQQNADGGWGDPRQGSDVLTTLAVAELMGQLDPSFEPADALEPLATLVQERGGRGALIGPEWPWVAAELLAFAEWSGRPFRERFRWPHMPDSAIDRKTHVPLIEAYSVYTRLFARIPGLGEAPVEIAFLDMAGFGSWNTDHGQAAGDDLLALLTAHLRTLPDSRTIRDGGDEFLVVGAPGADGLGDRMRALFARWPEVSLATYPSLPVVPLRAAVTTTRGRLLRETREELGKQIGVVKHLHEQPGPCGVVEQFPA